MQFFPLFLNQKITVSEGKTEKLSVKLKPVADSIAEARKSVKKIEKYSGYLAITSKPEGATVTVDGVAMGITPLKKLEANTGAHKIEISKLNFIDGQQTVIVQKGKTEKLSLTLRSAADTAAAPKAQEKKLAEISKANIAYLRITSKPSGAAVTIDGIDAGATPLEKLEVVPGDHTVLLSLTGFGNEEEKASVSAGKTKKLNFNLVSTRSAVTPEPSKTKSSDNTTIVKNIVRWTCAAAVLGMVQAARYYHSQADKDYDEYNQSTNPAQIGVLHDEIRSAEQNRNILIGVGVASAVGFAVTFAF